MNNKYLILISVILVLYDVNGAKRISELECDKTSKYLVDERSLNPYLMDIIKIVSETNSTWCGFATLISKNFVLSSDFFFDPTELSNKTKFKVKKLKLIGEEISDSQLFSIKSVIFHKFSQLLLIQLYEDVPYNFNTSIYQPACLWAHQILPSTNTCWTYAFHIIQDIHDNLDILYPAFRIQSRINEYCDGKPSYIQKKSFDICVNSSTSISFRLPHGSPVQTKIRNRNYVIGIVLHSFSSNDNHTPIQLVTKVNTFISWIESIVWPNNSCEVDQIVCGQRKIRHIPLISYGLTTYQGEFPWHVALFRVEGGRQNSHKYICGGTIIDFQTILTAAHCVVDERGVLPPNRLIIVAGTHNLRVYPNGTRNYGVDMITIHEEFNKEYLENDIALLKLNGPIKFSNYIQPICINNNLDFANNTTMIGTVTGWGKDELNQPSDVLLQAMLPIRDRSVCRRSDRDFFHTYLNEGNFCAGYGNGTNVCSGDSGGAMIMQYESRWYIRGIVSMGASLPNPDRCNLLHMVLFTDVDKFSNWILENL